MGKQIVNTDLLTPKRSKNKIRGLNQLQLAQLRDCLKESTVKVIVRRQAKGQYVSEGGLFVTPPPPTLF